MLSAVVYLLRMKAPHASIGTRRYRYRYPFYRTSISHRRYIQKSKKNDETARLSADPVPADHKSNKNHYWNDDRRTRPGEVKLDDFLAWLRIPIRACKENIRMVDIVHTEHTNADPGPGEEIFNFTRPAIKRSSRRRPDDFDYTDPGDGSITKKENPFNKQSRRPRTDDLNHADPVDRT
jgi:hypothetical protein